MKRLALGLSMSLLCSLGGAAHAAIITYSSILNGANEDSPNNSPATGRTTVRIDDVTNMMTVNASFSNLTAATTAAHIHCCTLVPFAGTAGVATPLPTFPAFPLGVTSGSYTETFNLLNASTYNTNFINANGGSVENARRVFLAGLASGQAYLNIHTTAFLSGEIRGFLTEVPEPGSIALFGLGAFGLAALGRRRGCAVLDPVLIGKR